MKVLHLPMPIGGQAWGLARGERYLGLDSDVLVLLDNWLHYPNDKAILNSMPKTLKEKLYALTKVLAEIKRIRNHYDVFHFNFGTSLLDLWQFGFPPLMDLPLYKGKIVVTYNGCDARQKYPTIGRVGFSACHNEKCYGGLCLDGKRDMIRKRKIDIFDNYASAIFAVNPDLLYFLPERARFLPYAVSKWDSINCEPFKLPGKKVKIVHSPTNREAKGTEIIMAAVEKAKEKYKDSLELITVENLPHDKALEIYRSADLIIDQILIGWYGAFSVEVMKMGKPVMVFIREEDLKFVNEGMARDCLDAFINVYPNNIFDRLCEIIENRERLKYHSEAGLEYVHKWHDPKYVASITKEAYENAVKE